MCMTKSEAQWFAITLQSRFARAPGPIIQVWTAVFWSEVLRFHRSMETKVLWGAWPQTEKGADLALRWEVGGAITPLLKAYI